MTDAPLRPRRSALYIPGTNARAIAKARTLAADALIFDLEDSVAPDAKASARATVAAALADAAFGRRECVIRINALSTPWGLDDLAAVGHSAPDAVLLPKVETAADLAGAAAAMAAWDRPVPVWAMIETPRGLLSIDDIFRSASGATRPTVAVIGTNDLATDLRTRPTPDRAPLLSHLATCVAAARAAGLDVLDGVFNDVTDADGFRRECEQGRDFGFDGKTLIHPSQIATANAVFGPSAADIAWAEAVIAAFAAAGEQAGVLTIDGRMVERLHLATARRTLALAAALA